MVNCASNTSFDLLYLIIFFCDSSRSSALNKTLNAISDVVVFTFLYKPTANTFTVA